MTEKTFNLSLVTPAKECLSLPVSLVEVPGERGDMGVLPGHAPMIAMMRPGVVSIHHESAGDLPGSKAVEKWFITAGYVDVTPERCSVLAESAVLLSECDLKEAKAQAKEAAKAVKKAKTPATQGQAEVRLREAEALVEALEA